MVAINPTRDLHEFFDFFYGEQTGYVYSPVKNPDNEEDFRSAFFEWPKQKDELVAHVLANTSMEVYFSPALYNAPNAKKEHVKGSYVLWVDFDGNAPKSSDYAPVPPPTLRVNSSEPGHEHVYWKLDYFEVDIPTIERANRSLAYQYKADTSGWDANQILRPVGTHNHKRNKPVVIAGKSDRRLSLEFFELLPEIPEVVRDVNLGEIPDALNVIAKYKWDAEAFDFFRKKEIPQGSRSSAMMRLGFYCTEMKMTDEEAFSILDNADQRWGKFVKRSDRKRRLLDIINRARLKYPLEDQEEVIDEFPIFSYRSLLDSDINVEWILPGFLQVGGSVLLSGPAGTGKSQLTIQFAIHMALGKSFLGYDIQRPYRMAIFSLEMGHAEIKYFISLMDEELTDDERDLLDQNLLILPIGEAVLLANPSEQVRIERFIKEHSPDGIVFDSLSVTTDDELASEVATKAIFMFINKIRNQHNLFTWFIHHNRKAQSNNKKPNRLADVFGSYIITSQPTAVVSLWPTHSGIEVTGLKIRLAPPFQFKIKRSDNLTFTKVEASDISHEDLKAFAANMAEDDEDGDNGQASPRFEM